MKFTSRILYFVFIGWWLGMLWAMIAGFFMLTLLLFPVGMSMLVMTPKVMFGPDE